MSVGLYSGDYPFRNVEDPVQQRINEDIYLRLRELSPRKLTQEEEREKEKEAHTHPTKDIIHTPSMNISNSNLLGVLEELDREKLSRWNHPYRYRTMLGHLLLGGDLVSNINLGIGPDITPSYPLQIDRKAPQIVIKNSLSKYPFTISVPETTDPKSFKIGSLGVQDELVIEAVDNRTYLSRPVVFGKKTKTSIERNVKDNPTGFRIDISTAVNIEGNLSIRDFTTLSTFTASGYGVIRGTFTVGEMIFCSSITPTGTVDNYDVSEEFFNLKRDTGTLRTDLDEVKIDTGTLEATKLGKTEKAIDSDKLDGYDYTAFVDTWTTQTAGGIKTFQNILRIDKYDGNGKIFYLKQVASPDPSFIDIYLQSTIFGGAANYPISRIRSYNQAGWTSAWLEFATGRYTGAAEELDTSIRLYPLPERETYGLPSVDFPHDIRVGEVKTSTITVSQVIELKPLTYLPTEVSTGTICNYWTGSKYEVYICTGVSGTQSLWGKFSVVSP